MPEGDLGVTGQRERREDELEEQRDQREATEEEERPSQFKTGGAIPPVRRGFAETKPAASERAFGDTRKDKPL
jgi:hypothetical protein